MGRSKDLFMQDREGELYEPTTRDPFEVITDRFALQAEAYDEGNADALDIAVKMRKDYERLEIQMNMRKSWLDENKDAIENEAAKYPEGYKGYSVKVQTRTTLDFKSVQEWLKLDAAKKDFEARSKAALAMVKKGGLNVGADGEEIPLPIENVTSYLKFEKLK